MAKSNRVRVDEIMVDTLRVGLAPYVLACYKEQYRGRYLVEMEIALHNMAGRTQRLPDEATAKRELDVQSWLNLMHRNWREVFGGKLRQTERNYLSELRQVRNRRAHENEANAFSTDDALRVADTALRLLDAVGAHDEAREVEVHRDTLRRKLYERQAKNSVKAETRRGSSDSSPAAESTTLPGLKPWRHVIAPHDDVRTGRFRQAEFALDLAQVVQGDAAEEYGDAKEFFRRTYLTSGLQGLLATGIARLTGQGGDPVVQLQTNFGGGKTHSMLALYHLCGGDIQIGDIPDSDALLERIGDIDDIRANRAVIVGTNFDPNEPRDHPDCITRTLWGEIAYQLGGIAAYELVAKADESGVSPGAEILLKLLEAHGPALIVIDELIAYARKLYGAPVTPASGTFDSVMSFMQSLTEAVKRSSDSMLLVSVPASKTEIGSEGGKAAFDAIANTLGRIESVWKPVTATESYEIVRRRLFADEVDYPARDAVIDAFIKMYGDRKSEFPPGLAEADYRRRMEQAYPIHPELFERLYEDWSTLENFQRTRGVLRMMAAVIHQLWVANGAELMIMPGMMPLYKAQVSDEILRYLPEGWGTIVDMDIDGDGSKPFNQDKAVSQLGKLAASRRVARTIFMGSAPSSEGQQVRGIETVRMNLGTTQPGESTSIFNDALRRMSNQLSYLYSEGSRYWYGARPTVSRLARDRAQQVSDFDVNEEVKARLRAIRKPRGKFKSIHIAPETSGDVPDEPSARLIVIDLKNDSDYEYGGKQGAEAFVREIFNERGSSPRFYRNLLFFIAPDPRRIDELKAGIRDYLAWKSIKADAETLNLDYQQGKQVDEALALNDETVESRIQETYNQLLALIKENPTDPDITYDPHSLRAASNADHRSLFERAYAEMDRKELLISGEWAPQNLLYQMKQFKLWRNQPHLTLKQLWDDFARYCYLPSLLNEGVLLNTVKAGISRLDADFGYATGIDGDGRYEGLVFGKNSSVSFGEEGQHLLVSKAAAQKQWMEDNQVVAPPAPPAEDKSAENGRVDAPPKRRPKTVYYGSRQLDAVRAVKEFGDMYEEVIRHLSVLSGAEVEITVEISAKMPKGFDEVTLRVVGENSRNLKFDSHEFEE